MSEKAFNYVLKRRDDIENEKQNIVDRIQQVNIEIEKVSQSINEIKLSVDSTYAVFSPRSQAGMAERDELNSLVNKKKTLNDGLFDLNRQLDIINDDINELDAIIDDDDQRETIVVDNNADLYGVKILEQQEFERQRIARELHDSPVQILTNLLHKCEICGRLIDKDSIRAKLELEVLSKSLKETIDEMREIIYDLRPMSIDDLGFNITLENVVNKLEKDCNFKIHLKINGEIIDLTQVLALTFIRIIQESVNNCKKHSNASNVFIEFTYYEDKISLIIKDDGIGISENILSGKENCGFGISMMKERIYLLAGDFNIISQPGKGTRIEAIVPII